MIKKLICCFLVVGLVLPLRPGTSLAKLSGQSRSLVGEYDINGYTPSSFYLRGGWYREEIDLKLDEKKLGESDLESFLSVRFTNDEYVDDQTSSIESMYAKLTGDNHGLELGDFYGKFSSYVLNHL